MAEHALVAAPIRAGELLPLNEWKEMRERAIFEFCKWDVQCEDHSVLARFPLLIELETARSLNEKAEALTREALVAEEEILSRPDVLRELGMPRAIRRELEGVRASHLSLKELRVMRFDFHLTTGGWRISEVNADVPGGFIEASSWNSLFAAKWRGTSAPLDTSELYADAILGIVGQDAMVALVHATAYSDDRQVMMYLARRFAPRGMRTCMCSPSHLRWKNGRAELRAGLDSGVPDTIVRFFPAEWLPNLATEDSWRPYFRATQTPLSNPGSAIVLQTKRFPLVWDELHTNLQTWRELLPETWGFSEVGTAPNESCVVKPALGRVGEDVGIRGVTTETEFEELLRRARQRPREWIAQERFEIAPVATQDGLSYPCIGVFTIGGKASGFYGRISKSPIINRDAQDVAVLICDERSEEKN